MALLGLDIGTSGTKALLLSEAGKVLATAESPHTMMSPKPGWTEQNPEEWWKACQLASRAVLKKAGISGNAVRGIGLSGQMHGSVFLDKNGKILRPALLWNDQRTTAQCAEIEAKAGGRAALIRMVSNPALTGFTAPKILWFRKNEPRKYEKCAQVLLPKDYIRYRLTGEWITEVSDASGTLLLDVKKRNWHAGLISKLGIDPELLPPVVESQVITGEVTAEAARELGVGEGIPVVGGAGDQAAGAVGTGVVSPGRVSASIGTSGVLFAASNLPQTDPQGRVHTMCHAIPKTWCVFGCMLSAGGSLQWLRNMLFPEEVAEMKDPGGLYPRMIAEAQRVPAGAEGLFFLPYLTGERCPHADPHARGCFIGLTPRHGRGHMIRSVLEGVTFGMREQAEIFRGMNIPITQVRASGGGARSELWRQMQADMYGSPVVTINAAEGAALGVAILAAVGLGDYATVKEATTRMIMVQHNAKPSIKQTKTYAGIARQFASFYPALRREFAEIFRAS